MNMIEKILAKASGKKEVVPGDIVVANVDRMVLHDLSSNLVSKVFENEMGGGTIFDPDRIVFVFDHTFSPPSQADADVLTEARRFAAKYGIRNVFDSGSGSIHHVIIENGLWAPGDVIIGCDSHTTVYGALGVFSTGVGNNSMAALGYAHGKAWFRVPETIQVRLHGPPPNGTTPRDVAQYLEGFLGEDSAVYRAVEYAGPFIENLSIEDRMLFPLMAIDLGAKAGYINPDEKTAAYAHKFSREEAFRTVQERPGCAVCQGHRRRRGAARAAGGLSAHGRQRQADRPGGGDRNPVGRNRRQHRRPLGRYPRSGASPARAKSSSRTSGCKWCRLLEASISRLCARG